VGPLVKFFTLTFLATWTCFISAVAISHQSALTDARLAVIHGLVFVASFAPALAALALIARADSISRTKTLLRCMFQCRVGARWYLLACQFRHDRHYCYLSNSPQGLQPLDHGLHLGRCRLHGFFDRQVQPVDAGFRVLHLMQVIQQTRPRCNLS
jgi:hypothetical protein